MSVERTYDLHECEPALFGQIRDAVAFGHPVSRIVAGPDQCLTVAVASEADGSALDGFVDRLRAVGRRLRRKVACETVGRSTYEGDIDADLAGHPDVHRFDDGLVALRGRVLDVFRFFEREFERWAREYDAEENRYPVMLPASVLEEVGYFAHFPQHVTFCSHLPEDLQFLEATVASASASGGRLDAETRAAIVGAAHVLEPAVCLPCYPQHRHHTLADGAEYAVSMQNHVFRYEAGNFRSLARLWDFTVRDIVFFGTAERLVARRVELMRRAVALCEELGLAARLQLANDPFFFDQSRHKAVYQRMGEVKFELVLSLPHLDDEIAAGSFNLHRDFYTRVYDIHFAGGTLAESACMGFGVERWVYGFLSQKGLDPARWPGRVAASLPGVRSRV